MKQTFRKPTPTTPTADAFVAAAVPAKSAAPGAAPWADASSRVRITFGVRMPEELHMKLTWLAEHTVNNSMHSIALEAIEEHVEVLLKKYYP